MSEKNRKNCFLNRNIHRLVSYEYQFVSITMAGLNNLCK